MAAAESDPPVVVAGVLLVDRRGWLLLQLRDGNTSIDPHRWCLPGGHAEPGEDPEAAARRELREETGLDVGALELVRDGPGASARYPGATARYVIFAANTDATDADVICGEGAAMRFVAPQVARGLPFGLAYGLVVPMFLGSVQYQRLTQARAPYTSPVDLLLLYTRGDEVLLALRSGTGYAAIWTEWAEDDLYAATMRR